MDRKIQSDAERDAREHRVSDSQRRACERQRGEHQEQAERDWQDGDDIRADPSNVMRIRSVTSANAIEDACPSTSSRTVR